MAEELIIGGAILVGVLIGIYEMVLVHRDISVPQHRFGHGVHAFVFAIVGTFISFNVPFVLDVTGIGKYPLIGSVLGLRIAIAIIMTIKIHGVSAALKSSGMASHGLKETWAHSLIIGALTGFSPYLWPFISGVLPVWLQ